MSTTEIYKFASPRKRITHNLVLVATPFVILPLIWFDSSAIAALTAAPVWQGYSLNTFSQSILTTLSNDGFAQFTLAARNAFSENQEHQQIAAAVPFNSSNGLIGAGVDPAYGQCNEVGPSQDFAYNRSRDLVGVATFLAFLAMLGIRIWQAVQEKAIRRHPLRKALNSAFVVGAVPAIIYEVGNFIITNGSKSL